MKVEIEEIWKDVVGYEDSYEVSSLGNVKSKTKTISQKNSFGNFQNVVYRQRILKLKISDSGYPKVSLSKNSKGKDFYTHRLVAIAFLQNLENKPEVNHKNGIKTDNRVVNLEWNTKSENVRHSYENGLSKSGSDHIQSIKIFQYSIDRQFIKEWGSAGEIKRKTGMTTGCICSCARGERPSAHGFFWSRQKLS
jgi:hypothetical protein